MRQPIFSSMMKVYLVSAIAYSLVLFAATQTSARDFVVVANAGLGVSEVSSSDLGQMLLGKKSTWASGERVTFSLFGDLDTQAAFLKQFVNKTPIQFKSYWKQRVFTGKGCMPECFATREEVMAFIKAHPGSFSFLRSPGDASVKTLTIK